MFKLFFAIGTIVIESTVINDEDTINLKSDFMRVVFFETEVLNVTLI